MKASKEKQPITNGAAPVNRIKEIKEARLAITAPNFQIAEFTVRGTSPYVQNRFPNKARQQIHDTQVSGPQAKGKKKRQPKDFDQCYKEAMHVSEEGWPGIPATAFRNAMIAACRVTDLKMTNTKLIISIEADGYESDATPLVKFASGEPVYHETYAQPESGGVDLRARPMWREWSAKVRIRFDADHMSLQDLAHLLLRAGMQVGIGEGRAFSKNSNGLGWGFFTVEMDGLDEAILRK